MCSTLRAACISQLRHGTRPKTKRGPEGLSNYRLSFDKVARPVISLFSCCSVVLFVFMEFSYLFGNTAAALAAFAQRVCVCGERRCSSFEIRESRGAAWVFERVSNIEGKREREGKSALCICQRKQFSWFGCQWSLETRRLLSEKTNHSFSSTV